MATFKQEEEKEEGNKTEEEKVNYTIYFCQTKVNFFFFSGNELHLNVLQMAPSYGHN